MKFVHPGDSHRHSLRTLDALYQYDDFMESIATLADLGCGSGEDLEWWATRTTRDEQAPVPLNIKCTGVDQIDTPSIARKYPNITYQKTDFEGTINPPKEKFDILWCHDAFQYCINPLQTLSNWWHITSDGGMLAIIVPQTINYNRRLTTVYQPSGCFYHYTIINLIHMLSATGWDCKNGFFLQRPDDAWLQAIVYKSNIQPQDPKKVTWYSLREQKLLPDSVDQSVFRHGHPEQQDLILPWIDKSFNVIV